MKYYVIITLALIHMSTFAQNGKVKGDEELKSDFFQLLDDKEIDFMLIKKW